MNFKLRNIVAATFAGTFLMGFGASAMADSTFDLVQALVSKGVLTEEEALPLLKGREADIHAADKKVDKKAKISISDAIDKATVYGDIRVRAEYRDGETPATTPTTKEARTRGRYKITFGVKTDADDFYTDLAFAMGSAGRSDNATFGGANGANNKETLFVKRAMVGWKATDWLTLEAGRVKNPLFTQAMVWDGDLTFEGLVEKMDFSVTPDTSIFVTGVQSQYKGDNKNYTNSATSDSTTNEIIATQVGVKTKFTDTISAKAALTYTTFTNDDKDQSTAFVKTIEVPAELSFKTDGTLGYKAFGDYVNNLDGSDRCKALAGAGCTAGSEDTAWLLGGEIKSVQDPKGKKSTKGDWKAKIWYQSVGAFALDPNAVDSDFMDSRVNMEGVVFKSEYNLRDNVFINFAAGYGDIKEKAYNTFSGAYATQKGDIDGKLDNFSLYQLDMTYKF
jgi:polyhydroxyalkanoate synthesis regulator phasin